MERPGGQQTATHPKSGKIINLKLMMTAWPGEPTISRGNFAPADTKSPKGREPGL